MSFHSADRHLTEIRVRYAETDQMARAYHSRYIEWFEVARTEYMRAIGMNYRELEKSHGLFLPVIEVKCQYLAPAYYDDVLSIYTTIKKGRPVEICFDYEVFNNLSITLAKGYSRHVFMNRDGKPVKPPGYYRNIILRPDSTIA